MRLNRMVEWMMGKIRDGDVCDFGEIISRWRFEEGFRGNPKFEGKVVWERGVVMIPGNGPGGGNKEGWKSDI